MTTIDLNNLTYQQNILQDGTIELLIFSESTCIGRQIYNNLHDVNSTINRLNLTKVS